MAAKEIAQKPIDLSSGLAAGTPLVATDATHVDQTAGTIVNVTASASGGSSVLAAAQDHGHALPILDSDALAELVNARSLLGSANLFQLFDDLAWQQGTAAGAPWILAPSASATNVVLTVAGTSCGIRNLQTSAIVAQNSRMYNAGQAPIIKGTATDKWYMSTRFKLPTTPDAQTNWRVGFVDYAVGNTFAYLGVDGSQSTTKFLLQTFNASSVYGVSTISIDTGWHIGRAWYDGTNVKVAFDGETAVVLTSPKFAAGPAFSDIQLSNGTTAANQQAYIDWVNYVTPRGTP